jgi:putative sigma-54 modulation protein
MNIEIKAVHFDLPEEYQKLIEKKIQKIEFAQDLIVDLLFSITKEKNYSFEAKINFRWGASHHFKVKDFDIRSGLEKLFDKIEAKVSKEKGKIKTHK